MIERITQEQFEEWIQGMEKGRNNNFAKGAMNLWIRFKNFEENAPFVLRVNGDIKCAIMITKLSRSSYINLYEIVTATGEEGNGYASKLYWDVIAHFYDDGVKRLKMSCTPSSIGWHFRNGVITWGVDATGSLRVDVPLRSTKAEQLLLRDSFEDNRDEIIPPPESVRALLKENPVFGIKKSAKVQNSIDIMGVHHRRDLLLIKEIL
jgi:hypothetical protein